LFMRHLVFPRKRLFTIFFHALTIQPVAMCPSYKFSGAARRHQSPLRCGQGGDTLRHQNTTQPTRQQKCVYYTMYYTA
jgi:hypothetical protein